MATDSLLTAVQLRDEPGLEASLLYGAPHSMMAGSLGPIALFAPGRLVAYQAQVDGRRRVFVFRTLPAHDGRASGVPGVFPRVNLLLEVRTRGRAERVRKLFRFLVRDGWEVDALSDAFFVRTNQVLGGRLTSKRAVLALLRHEA